MTSRGLNVSEYGMEDAFFITGDAHKDRGGKNLEMLMES